MPTLGGTPPAHHGFGRPRREDRDPYRCGFAAFGFGIWGVSYRTIARVAWQGPNDWKTAKLYVRSGEKWLHGRGVMPWALWNQGKLPEDWWYRTVWIDFLGLWAKGKFELQP